MLETFTGQGMYPLNHDKTMEEVGHCLDLDESRLQLRFLELNQPSNFAVYEGKYKLLSITGTASSYTSTALDTIQIQH